MTLLLKGDAQTLLSVTVVSNIFEVDTTKGIEEDYKVVDLVFLCMLQLHQ